MHTYTMCVIYTHILSFLFLKRFYLLCISVSPACMSVHHMHTELKEVTRGCQIP